MDAAADQPRVVIVGQEACADPDRVAPVLAEALGSPRSPGLRWAVHVRVSEIGDGSSCSRAGSVRVGPPDAGAGPCGGVRAEAEIVTGGAEPLARRVLVGSARECPALAQAVGVWASLVLEREAARAPLGASSGVPATSPSAPHATPSVARDAGVAAPAGEPMGADEPALETRSDAGASPPADGLPRRELRATMDIGAGTFLMAGTGANAVMGATPYAVFEPMRDLYLRTALIVGESLVPLGSPPNRNVFLLSGRFDGCSRVAGNYTGRGLEVAACGGFEVGYTYFHAAPAGYAGYGAPASGTALADLSLGPSLEMAGELVSSLLVVLRGVGGINVLRGGFDDTQGNRVRADWVSARLELAFSWRVR